MGMEKVTVCRGKRTPLTTATSRASAQEHALNSGKTIERNSPRTWLGRFFARRGRVRVARWNLTAIAVKVESDCLPHQTQVELRAGLDLLLLPLFFIGPAFLNDLAETAGMLAIKGLRERFFERRALRVAHNHARPRDGLEQCPMHRPNERTSTSTVKNRTTARTMTQGNGKKSPVNLRKTASKNKLERLTSGEEGGIHISLCGEIQKQTMRKFMNITKALADENRVRALLALRKGELCVCQITELFGLAPSTISKHLSILFQAGLVESRKDGRWIYYQLPGKDAQVVVREALDWIEKALADSPHVLEDNKQLKKILRQDPAELCKKQCQR